MNPKKDKPMKSKPTLNFDRAVLAFVALGCVALPEIAFAQKAAVPGFPAGNLVPSGAVLSHTDTPGTAPALPASFPDKFAWSLFVRVNQKAAAQVPIEGHPDLLSNDAVWETWADDPWTFPAEPDPGNPPKWPPGAQPGKHKATLRRAVGLRTSPAPASEGADVQKVAPGGFEAPNGAGVGEEVRRNKATFDFIITNGLWYQQGIAAFFARAAAAAKDDVKFTAASVTFPRDSIEVKANWIVIKEADKPRFHWNYDTSGQLLGLVAMHMISKDLPNWFWCTFEHVDNPGRGDYIGVHDAFGADPAHTPSHTDKLFQKYPAEKQTAALLALFEKNGFTGEWGSQWRNYRLKGSQVDFTDQAGRPLVLGNSVTEAGFVPTASCITCHSRAAVTGQGTSAFPLFGEQSSLPLVGVAQQGTPNATILTYNGLPDPGWYFRNLGAFSSQGVLLETLQTDFVWAIPFKAKPAKSDKK
jgi:hypothetical protein